MLQIIVPKDIDLNGRATLFFYTKDYETNNGRWCCDKLPWTIHSFPMLKGVFGGLEDCLVIAVLVIKAWEPIFESTELTKVLFAKGQEEVSQKQAGEVDWKYLPSLDLTERPCIK